MLLLTALVITSCNDNKVAQTETTETPETADQSDSLDKEKEDIDLERIKGFLSSIYTPDGATFIFEDNWIHKHCTQKMQQTLRDEYDYEGEGWGSWLIGGWAAGEEISTKVTDIKNEGSYYFVTLEPTGESCEFFFGKRVIRFEVNVIDDIPVINDCKWVEDFDYSE